MWVNFSDNNRRDSNISQRGARLQLPTNVNRKNNIKTNGRTKSTSGGLTRQNSNQSSIRSNKSSSNNLKKKIEEHYFHTNTAEWQKEEEYRCRRNRRNQLEKQRKESQAKLSAVRRLYIPAVVLILVGIGILFGSTIRSLGEGSILWTRRETFCIVGPVVLVGGIIFLLVVVGVENRFLAKKKLNNDLDLTPFIHPDFKLETTAISRQTSVDTGVVDLDRERSLYSLDDSQNRSFFLNNNAGQARNMSPNLANMSTPHVHPSVDFTSQWAHAMSIQLELNDKNKNIPPEVNIETSGLQNRPYVFSTSTHTDPRHYSPVCVRQPPEIFVKNADDVSATHTVRSSNEYINDNRHIEMTVPEVVQNRMDS